MFKLPGSESRSQGTVALLSTAAAAVIGFLSCFVLLSDFLLAAPMLGGGVGGRTALIVALALGLRLGIWLDSRLSPKGRPLWIAAVTLLIFGLLAQVYPYWVVLMGELAKAVAGAGTIDGRFLFIRLLAASIPALGPAALLTGFIWARLIAAVDTGRPRRGGYNGPYLIGVTLALLASPLYAGWGIVTPLRFAGAMLFLAAVVAYVIHVIVEPDDPDDDRQLVETDHPGGSPGLSETRLVLFLSGLFAAGWTAAAINVGRSVLPHTPYVPFFLIAAGLLSVALGLGWRRLNRWRRAKAPDTPKQIVPISSWLSQLLPFIIGVIALITWGQWYPLFERLIFPDLVPPDWIPGIVLAGVVGYGLPLIVIGVRSGKTAPGGSQPTARAAADLMAGVISVGIALGLAGGVGQWGWITGALFALIGLVLVVMGLWGMSGVRLRLTLVAAIIVLIVSAWSGLLPVYPGETDSPLSGPGLGKGARGRDKSGARQLIQDGFQLAGASPAHRKRDKLSVHLPLLLAEKQPRSALVIGMASPWLLETLNLYEVERISVSEPPTTALDSAEGLRAFLKGGDPTDPVDYEPVQFPALRHLLFSEVVYDVIIGAAVWPLSWLGDDGLSQQFLTLLRNHLTPGGGVSLAVPMNALDLASFRSVCRTFQAVFPTVSLWWSISEPNPYAIFIGWNSTNSFTIDYSALKNRLKLDEKLGPELAGLHLREVDDLLDYYIGDESTLEGLSAGASLVDRYRSSLLFPGRSATAPTPDERTALSASGMHRWRRNVIRRLRNLGPDRETQAAVRKNLERRVEASGQLIKSHIHYFDKSPGLSRDDLDRALRITPSHAAATAVMAARRAADRSARELVDRAPRNPDYRFDYGNLLFEQGNFEEAINQLQTAIELDPTRLDTHILLGQAYQSIGKYDEANRAFARALVVDPDNYQIQLYIGLSYYLFSKELDSAVVAFRKGIEIRPDYAPFYNYLGLCFFATKVFWRESIEEFKTAIELNPELSEAYFNLGNVYSERWYIQRAVEYYNRAVELNPYNPIYHSALAWAYVSRSSFDQAIRSFREAYALDPNEGRLRDIESAAGMKNLYIKNIEAGRIRIRQILVQSEDEAGLVLKRLKDGEDFPVVARDMSIAPDASKGGDLGFLAGGMVHQNIEEVILRIKPGDISGIIQTPLGFHVVQRIN